MTKRKRIFHIFFAIALMWPLFGCISGDNYAPVVNGWNDPSAMKSRYRVQEGDTIYSIACAFEVDYRDLVAANHLPPPYELHTGQTLSMVKHPEKQVETVTHSLEKSPPINEIGHNAIIEPEALKSKPEKAPPSVEKKKLTSSDIVLPELQMKPIEVATAKKTMLIDNKQIERHPDVIKNTGSQWLWPATGKVIRQFSLQDRGGNKGIDIAGKYGEMIRAAAPGQVVYCGSSLKGYGNLIILKHNESYLTLYGHNKKLLVREGEWVKAGCAIAEMGQTNSGQTILHFEVRRFGKPVNPLNFIHSE